MKNKRKSDGTIIKESMGIIPIVLQTLLDQRKATRKKIKQTNDDNKKKVLDGFQLAYKVTANSVYGQMGAKSSSVFFKKIAACTTAIGRERIDDARIGVKRWAEEEGYDEPDIVYGDTDSVYFSAYKSLEEDIKSGKLPWTKDSVISLYDRIGDEVNTSFPDFVEKFNNAGGNIL